MSNRQSPISVYSDGGARGNPGPAAYGFVVKQDDKNIHEQGGYIGIATNNAAEYTAIVEALTYLKNSFSGQDLKFFVDSQLVYSQLSGLFKVKNAAIRDFVFKIRELEADFKSVMYTHIPREQNQEADRQVNIALDNHLFANSY